MSASSRPERTNRVPRSSARKGGGFGAEDQDEMVPTGEVEILDLSDPELDLQEEDLEIVGSGPKTDPVAGAPQDPAAGRSYTPSGYSQGAYATDPYAAPPSTAQSGSYPPQAYDTPPHQPAPYQGAGYPAEQGAGYPAEQGAGYPAEQGAGYPAQQGASYPAQQGASYPAAPSAHASGSPPLYAPGTDPGAVSMDDSPTRVEKEEDIRASLDGTPRHEGPIVLIIGGNNRGREYPISKSDTSIGRGVDNDIILADIAVSRKHTLICFEDRQYVVRDLGSGNGTLLNGRRVESHPLQDGDQLELGNTLLRFVFPQAAARPGAPMAQQETVVTGREDAQPGKPVKPAADARRQPTELAVPAKHPKTVRKGKVAETTPAASRSRKLLIFGSIGLVVLLCLMVGIKLLVASKKQQQAADAKPTRSPDEVAAEEFQLGTTQYRARAWEKARTHFLKVLSLAPSFDQARRYADQSASEIMARDALERAKNSLNARDFQTSRVELSKVPSTSVYAADVRSFKQRVDDEQLSELLQKARALKEAGDTVGAQEKVKEALEIAPTSQPVLDLQAELTEGKPHRRSPIASRAGTPGGRLPQRRPAPAAAPAERPIKISGTGKVKEALTMYRRREWGPAFQAVKDHAQTQNGRRKKEAEALADTIRRVGQAWIRAERSSSPGQAMRYYNEAMKYDKKIGRGGMHQKELKDLVFAQARKEASTAFSKGSYTAAFSALKLAKSYGKEDAVLRNVAAGLEKKAEELFNKGYTMRTSNVNAARRSWQQVLKMVPPSSPIYMKAYKWLNNSGPSYQDEDED